MNTSAIQCTYSAARVLLSSFSNFGGVKKIAARTHKTTCYSSVSSSINDFWSSISRPVSSTAVCTRFLPLMAPDLPGNFADGVRAMRGVAAYQAGVCGNAAVGGGFEQGDSIADSLALPFFRSDIKDADGLSAQFDRDADALGVSLMSCPVCATRFVRSDGPCAMIGAICLPSNVNPFCRACMAKLFHSCLILVNGDLRLFQARFLTR
ncbi:MAG: hypothetical protein U0V48_16350 [Anaerolineales bacterium]